MDKDSISISNSNQGVQCAFHLEGKKAVDICHLEKGVIDIGGGDQWVSERHKNQESPQQLGLC
jgi:hypothetical protein